MGTSMTYRKLLLIVTLIFSQWTYAQNDTYFALPPLLEWEREGMDLQVQMSTSADTSFVWIYNSDTSLSVFDTVLRGALTIVEFDTDISALSSPYGFRNFGWTGVRSNDALFVEASQPITVTEWLENSRNQEIITGKGRNGIGQDFYLASQTSIQSTSGPCGYCGIHYVSIVSLEDGNSITVAATSGNDFHTGNSTVTFTLNQGESWVGTMDDADALLGTRVTSSGDITVTAGGNHLRATGVGNADAGLDQVTPIDQLGTFHVVLHGRANNPLDYFMWIATQPNTTISLNGTNFATNVAAGASGTRALGNADPGTPYFVESNNPIYLYQVTTGTNGNQPELGMAQIPHAICTGSTGITYNRVTGLNTHAIITIPDTAVSDLLYNNNPVTSNSQIEVEQIAFNGNWSGVYIPDAALTNSFTLECPTPFHVGIMGGIGGSTGLYGYISDFDDDFALLDPNTGLSVDSVNFPVQCADTIEFSLDFESCDEDITVLSSTVITGTGTIADANTSDTVLEAIIDPSYVGPVRLRFVVEDGRGFSDSIFYNFDFVGSEFDPIQEDTLFVCVGQTGTLQVVNTPLTPTYQWSGAGTNQSQVVNANGWSTVRVNFGSACDFVDSAFVLYDTINTSLNITSARCNGQPNGGADLTVTSLAGPYSYSWNDPSSSTTQDISGVPAGTYQVAITDTNGCVLTTNAIVPEPSVLSAATTPTDASCNGEDDGMITLTTNGGTTPYSFSWSNSSTTANIDSLIAGTYNVTVTDSNGCTATSTGVVGEPTALTSTVATTNAVCFGNSDGTATLGASGGTAPYTYLWSNSNTTSNPTNLAAGTYTFTVTDANSCEFSGSTGISEPADIIITATTYDVLCRDDLTGSLDASVAGGIGTLLFQWNDPASSTSEDISGLAAGNYTVTVTDDSLCSGAGTFTINQPATSISLSSTLSSSTTGGFNINCNGGNDGGVSLAVNGGTGSLTYLWTSGGATVGTTQNLTSASAGNYIVAVTDGNGCVERDTFDLTEPALPINIVPTPSTSLTGVFNINCTGGSDGAITLAVTGGTGTYTYLWTSGGSTVATTQNVSGLSAGSYKVVVTDENACSDSVVVTLNEPAAAVDASATASLAPAGGFNISCNGGNDGAVTLSVSGGTGAYTYAWTRSGSAVGTTQNLNNLVAGTYIVVVTDANGCTDSDTLTLTEPPTPLTLALDSTDVSCFSGNDGQLDLTVTGGTAGFTYSWNDPSATTSEDVSGLSVGLYTVNVTDANGCTSSASGNIDQPTALALSETHVNNVCNGGVIGSIDLSVAGGTSPYSFAWDDPSSSTTEDISGLTARTYEVTVTDSLSCVEILPITITEPSAIQINPTLSLSVVGTTNINCNGGNDGAITLAVSGGTGAYNYAWTRNGSSVGTTQNLTGLIAGTYIVSVTDANGCIESDTVVLTEPAAPISIIPTLSASAAGGYNISCNGGSDGSISIAVNGGSAPYNYAWTLSGAPVGGNSASVSSLAAGAYVVVVTDVNGCS